MLTKSSSNDMAWIYLGHMTDGTNWFWAYHVGGGNAVMKGGKLAASTFDPFQ